MRLVLCLEYPIDQHGGTEVLVAELVRGLSERHEIVLVSADTDASFANSPLKRMVACHIPWQTEPATRRRAQQLAEAIARTKPDLVHFHFGGNYAWKNRAFNRCPVVHLATHGVPCLSTNHGAFSIFEGYCWSARPWVWRLGLFLPAWISKQYVLAHLRCEVAVSQNDYRALRRWYPLMRSRFRWIYHSRLGESTPPPFNPRRRLVVLCAGTIGERKGQPLLVDAFARVAPRFPAWNLVLIGRCGSEVTRRELEANIARHKLESQIQMLGPRSDAELREWFRTAAIFAMPSVYEGLGLTLQEAQFYGCACVATRCGGPTDLITDGENGRLVPVGDAGALARALDELMGDATQREQVSRRGPASVLAKGMTINQMIKSYEKLYAESVNL